MTSYGDKATITIPLKEYASLQRELEEVKNEKLWLEGKVAISELKPNELLSKLAASEAKVERMKEGLLKYGRHNLCVSDSKCNCGLTDLINETPSTSLDLYHKERNKKELGEVEESIESAKRKFDEATEYSCTCNSDITCTHCSKWEAAERLLNKALAILKRLTE